MQKIAIIDYGMGNLQSVKKQLDGLKVDAIITSDKESILSADKIILPGVGHFSKAMENLHKLDLINTLNVAVLEMKKPILGICLGMQLMAKHSEEGETEGLGWFDAGVVKFRTENKLKYKIPHTGWNTISFAKENSIMTSIPVDAEFYFIHSYYMRTNKEEDVLCNTEYGKPFVSGISKDNIYGFQFHPEKSHDAGKQLLKNFLMVGFESLSQPINNPTPSSRDSLTEALEGNDTEALEGNDNQALEGNDISKTNGMWRPRIIPVLLLQKLSLVKTLQFKNPTYIGDPINAVKIFNELKADELVFLDIEASKEDRLISLEFIKDVGEEANMPFAVGGGIRTIEDIRLIIAAGAEKVIINSAAVANPEFIRLAADTFGSSTICVCIDVKKKLFGSLKVWSQAGKKESSFSPIEFAKLMEEKGAGEIIIQSIEKDGAMSGYAIELIREISAAVTIPVVALGGAGSLQDLKKGYTEGFANGLAAGSLFVFQGTKKGVLINYPKKGTVLDTPS